MRRAIWPIVSRRPCARRRFTLTPTRRTTSSTAGTCDGETRPARPEHATIRHPDGTLRLREDAGDPGARRPRLLLHRQPADAAHSDDGGAGCARGELAGEGRHRRRRPREGIPLTVPACLPKAARRAEIEADADLPGSEPFSARPPLQRNAAAASAGARSLGERGDYRGAR